MSDPGAALVLAGVDPERLEVQPREILGPHIFVRCGTYVLSIVGEIDVDRMDYGRRLREPQAALPLRPDVVEIGLLRADRRELLAEPLRYVPFERAAEICRLALAGDVDAFRPLYAEEDA